MPTQFVVDSLKTGKFQAGQLARILKAFNEIVTREGLTFMQVMMAAHYNFISVMVDVYSTAPDQSQAKELIATTYELTGSTLTEVLEGGGPYDLPAMLRQSVGIEQKPKN